jgi:hypothetical protein
MTMTKKPLPAKDSKTGKFLKPGKERTPATPASSPKKASAAARRLTLWEWLHSSG